MLKGLLTYPGRNIQDGDVDGGESRPELLHHLFPVLTSALPAPEDF